jgi:hypothetical protein
MARGSARALEERTVDELKIDDERSFRHVTLYADLKEILRRDRYAFRILPPRSAGRASRPVSGWDRALFLNLTYWTPDEGDVLEGPRVAADVITHAAWHHLAARALPPRASRDPRGRPRQSRDALFLGESIASAFDAYLVGRLLGHAPRSAFLRSQVPRMAEVARAAGLSGRRFEALLARMAEDPAGSFGQLRALLADATRALDGARDAGEAYAALLALDAHPFAPLLHRYEMSNWVLHARAYGGPGRAPDPRARAIETALRRADDPLSWLVSRWVGPALGQQVAR